MTRLTEADRFWSKVRPSTDPTACWEWQGGLKDSGYGSFEADSTNLAHRWSYQAEYGPIPTGMCVCHKCDNRKCIRPNHLFLGTRADNNRDRDRKGRGHKANGHTSWIRDEGVLEMRRLHASGMRATDIQRKFGLSKATTCKILRGDAWSHLPVNKSLIGRDKAQGENQGSSKLTDEQVMEMRMLHALGMKFRDIPKFGMSIRAARKAMRGESWKHLPMPQRIGF